jgi:raffinose/stachyose/melibiose transport system permease protein
MALPQTRPSRRRRPHRVPLWFGLPAAAVFLFVILVPSAQGVGLSLTDWNGITDDFSFVGLENFARIFTDPRALGALQNTIVLAIAVTVLQNALGLALALGVNGRVKSRHLLRVIFFTPVVLTPLVSGYIWGYLLSPRGTVNETLETIGLGFLRQTWLGDPRFALGAICVAIIWQFAGYSMVIFLAGLQAIPAEIEEAAVLDGAGPVRRFLSVTFPLINGALVINLLLTLIGSLSQFDQVMAMTGGGPGNATQTVSTSIFRIGFAAGDYPYGIALAVVMTVLVAGAAALQYRFTSRKVTF